MKDRARRVFIFADDFETIHAAGELLGRENVTGRRLLWLAERLREQDEGKLAEVIELQGYSRKVVCE